MDYMITEKKYNGESMESALIPSLGGNNGGALGGNAPGSPKGTNSGRFTNLQSYINKNRGATNQTLNKANSDSAQLQNDYQTNVGRLNDVSNKVVQDYGNVRTNQDTLNRLADNPYDDGLAQNYQTARAGAVASKDPVLQSNRIQSDLRGLADRKNSLANINTSGGIRNYLNSIRGDRAGSAGGMNLDEFLLSSTPEANLNRAGIANSASGINLDYTPGVDINSEYNFLAGFDPESIASRIQTRLQGDLNVNDFDSVKRYNDMQNYYGGALADYQLPQGAKSRSEATEFDRFLGSSGSPSSNIGDVLGGAVKPIANEYRGGIKPWLTEQNWQPGEVSDGGPIETDPNPVPVQATPPSEFDLSLFSDPTKDLSEEYNENKKINRFGFGGYVKGGA